MHKLPFRYLIPTSLLLLTVAAALWSPARWTLWLLIPATLLSLLDYFQHRHTLRRNYPLIARIRWIMED
ncbi:MAG TPA: hypothetical protein PK625_01180, partial [Spirochaetales bacterium]|nr:hypothetical protein [Spirochaetales bacterium]